MKRPSSARRPSPARAWRRAARPFLALALAAVALCGGGRASGQGLSSTNDLTALSLEDLSNVKVYAASKVEQKVSEAPSPVTIVTSEEIKKFGYRTLADILETVPGFNISYDRNYAFVGVSGVSLGDFNSRILLLVNGHRVNEDLSDGAYVDTSFILDVDLIDRVEVIRGPGSALYGDNAFFAVINVITRQPAQINGFEASADYDSFDTYKVRATYGKAYTNGVNVLFSGTYYDSAGQPQIFFKEFDTPQQNNGIAQDMDADRYRSLFGSVNFKDFTLEAAYNHREKVNPTAQFNLTTFNDPRLETVDERSYVDLKYAHSFPDVVDVSARVYVDSYSHNIGYPQSLIVGNTVVYNAFTTEQDVGEWWGSELQLNKTLFDRLALTLGADYTDDFLQEASVSGQPTVERTRQSFGLYGQADYALLSNLHLDAGGRIDKYGDFSPSYDPRLALIYEPVKGSTLKAIYGTAFRAPNFSELIDPRFQDIHPEEISSYNFVYEQQYGPHIKSSISTYYNQMDHLIVFDDGVFTNMNARTKGVEVALENKWANGIIGRASYSFQDTRNDTVGWQVPDSPDHMAKLSLAVPLWTDKLSLGLEVLYVSARQTLHNTTDASGEPITVQGEGVGGYGLVNLTLFSKELVKNLEISASVYNLLNTYYEDPASRYHVEDAIPEVGRSFRFKLTYRF